MPKRGTLSIRIPAADLVQSLNHAAALMRTFDRRVLTTEALLYAYLQLPDTAAHRILRRLFDARGFNWDDFERDVARVAERAMAADVNFDFETDANQRIALGDDVLYLIDEGFALAQSRSETRCTTAHTLAFMTKRRVSASRLLLGAGVSGAAILDALGQPEQSGHFAARNLVSLAKENLLPPVHPRQELLRDLMNVLNIAKGRNTVLVGQSGVGRRSLVYTLAHAIADGNAPVNLTSVFELREEALLDNPALAMRAGVNLAKGGALFVPAIDRFFGGLRAEFPRSAVDALQKAYLEENVVILGAATPNRFAERLESNAIIQQGHVLHVPPTDVAETVQILVVLQPSFQADYQLEIEPDSLEQTARLAGRYLTADPMPRSAVQLLHRACALAKLGSQGYTGVSGLSDDHRLDPEDVMIAASLLTGIPVNNMGADERDRYAHMVEQLHQRIIGQDEAIVALSRAVKAARVGLKDPKRPIGSFLFLGPTGVGKSELAKALAEFMFGTEAALITLDMSEYMDESSVNRLIGSPPGYVGHEAGGQLTDAVKSRPYSVVLFDEVEKAALKVFDVLLQIMDEGRLTSGKGETVSFSDCVILMTSNIGGRYLSNPELGDTIARTEAERELKAHFRPEFLNRLDDIIFFHLLNDDQLRQILDLLLRKETTRLSEQNLSLTMTDEAKTWLLAQNEHPEWGARPLRRLIQQYIRSPLADFLLEQDPQAGVSIRVDAPPVPEETSLVFEMGT